MKIESLFPLGRRLFHFIITLWLYDKIQEKIRWPKNLSTSILQGITLLSLGLSLSEKILSSLNECSQVSKEKRFSEPFNLVAAGTHPHCGVHKVFKLHNFLLQNRRIQRWHDFVVHSLKVTYGLGVWCQTVCVRV